MVNVELTNIIYEDSCYLVLKVKLRCKYIHFFRNTEDSK